MTEGLKILLEALKKLSSLQSISLNFSSWEIRDEDLAHIADALQRLSSSLRSVYLNFYRCSSISDQGLKNLG